MANRFFEPPSTADDLVKYYEKGKEYNNKIDLSNTVETNRYFYIGKQWEGKDSAGLQTVMLNFIKPTVQVKVASIMSDDVAIVVRPSGIPGATEAQIEKQATVLTNELNRIWEKRKLTAKTRKTLTNAAVDGDGCWHLYWNPKAKVATVDPATLTEKTKDAALAQPGQPGTIGYDMGIPQSMNTGGIVVLN